MPVELGVIALDESVADDEGLSDVLLGSQHLARRINKHDYRFAIIVDDGVATAVAVDEPGQFEVSSAQAILERL